MENYLAILFSNYFKGTKISWLFAQLYKNYSDCFVFKVSAVGKFQNRIYIVHQGKEENKILYIANEQMGAATVDSQ